MRSIFALGRGDRPHNVIARIEFLGDPSDCAALAGGIPAFEYHHQRAPLLIRLQPEQMQFALQRGQLLFVFGFAKPLREVDVLKHGG